MFNLYKHHVEMVSIIPWSEYTASEIKALTEEAKNNNPVAQYNLGVFYASGHNIEENRALSDKWITKSAKLGDLQAQFSLGEKYYCNEDYKKAFHWLSKAANKEHIDSMSMLSTMYFNGKGVGQDYEKAFYLFTKSMCRHNSYDQYFLGYLYENGLGVEQNHKEAIRWYQFAIDQNNPSAKNKLGIMYLFGKSVEKDQEKGFKLISESAEQMETEGCFHLGLMYAKGIYVKQDYQLAKKYLLLADDYGDYCDCKLYAKAMKKINSALEKQTLKSQWTQQ